MSEQGWDAQGGGSRWDGEGRHGPRVGLGGCISQHPSSHIHSWDPHQEHGSWAVLSGCVAEDSVMPPCHSVTGTERKVSCQCHEGLPGADGL